LDLLEQCDDLGDVVDDCCEVALVQVFNGLLDEWDECLDVFKAVLKGLELFWFLVLAFLDGLVEAGDDLGEFSSDDLWVL